MTERKWQEIGVEPSVRSSIALYLPTLASGGAERTLLHLAEGFRVLRWKVTFVVDRAVGDLRNEVARLGFPLQVLQARRLLDALVPLVRWLKRDRPAVLLTAIIHNNLIALWANRLAGQVTRVVISDQGRIASMRGELQFSRVLKAQHRRLAL